MTRCGTHEIDTTYGAWKCKTCGMYVYEVLNGKHGTSVEMRISSGNEMNEYHHKRADKISCDEFTILSIIK